MTPPPASPVHILPVAYQSAIALLPEITQRFCHPHTVFGSKTALCFSRCYAWQHLPAASATYQNDPIDDEVHFPRGIFWRYRFVLGVLA